MARAAGYHGMLVTDHSDVYWEYPCLGTTIGVRKNSLRERGFANYLDACRRVQARNLDICLLPGVEASPYYYWSGRLLSQRLVNHEWMKHLVVVGIEDPKVYRQLPMLAYHTSAYRPGFTDHGEAPYQDFVHAVHAAGGMAFWAHPMGGWSRKLAANIFAECTPYPGSLLTVPESAGIAMFSAESAVSKPGGLWDQALLAYGAGERPVLPRAMVEIDFHRGAFTPKYTLTALIPPNAADAIAPRKQAVLDALRRGRYYVASGAPGMLVLQHFEARVPDDTPVTIGETIAWQAGIAIEYSLAIQSPLQWVQLIRDGRIVSQTSDATGRLVDEEAPRAGTSGYYRLAARDRQGRFLLSNPILYTCKSAETP